ncbi:MAG: CBS domain-containing protein [bacterium]
MVGVQERVAGRLRVRDVMTSPAVTVKENTPVKEVAEVLLRHRISGVPVVSESGELVGILTEADLLYKELPEENGGWRFRPDPQGLRKKEGVVARDLMTWPVITVEEDTPVREAARLMGRHRVNRLPVVRAGQVVGIVSRADVIKALARQDSELERAVRGVLLRELWIDPATVQVRVEGGVVYLEGTVDRWSDKELVERWVAGIDGVLAVRSQLAYRFDDRRPAGTVEPFSWVR